MQHLFCEVLRASMKLGIAIAASRPITVTTIMISTNVKPPFRDVLMFILPFLCSGVNEYNRWINISSISVHLLPVANRSLIPSIQGAKLIQEPRPVQLGPTNKKGLGFSPSLLEEPNRENQLPVSGGRMWATLSI